MKISLALLGFCLCCNGSLAAANEEIPESIATIWSEQHKEQWQPIKGRCWKANKGRAIKEAVKLLFEIDLVDWFSNKSSDATEGLYSTLYRRSRTGLINKMHRFGYSLSRESKAASQWTVLQFSHPSKTSSTFKTIAPGDIVNYRANLDRQLLVAAGTAFKDCVASKKTPTRSLAQLVYIALRQMSPSSRRDALATSLRSWSTADKRNKKSTARFWLLVFSQHMSLLSDHDRSAVYLGMDGSQKRRLLSQLTALMEKASDNDSYKPERRLRYAWFYHSGKSALEQVNAGMIDRNVTDPGNDPSISLTIADTARLLHLAEGLARAGDLNRASNVVQRLLMWQLGTRETGLALRRPISDKGDITTPYPIWLALVPAYRKLSDQMDNQGNALTGEQYNIARTLSRDQYVSGAAEEAIWLNFEQVLNR